MGRNGKRALLAAPVFMALVAGALVAGPVGAAAGPDPVGSRAAADLVAADLVAADEEVLTCDGGAQQRALVRLGQSPTTIPWQAGIQALPGATVPFNVPADQSRQVIVTFTAEAFLEGIPLDLAQPVSEIQVTVLLDGAPMPAANAVTFNTDAGQHDALESCRRVGPGAHLVTVLWQVVDNGGMPIGTLETWSLHVEINL